MCPPGVFCGRAMTVVASQAGCRKATRSLAPLAKAWKLTPNNYQTNGEKSCRPAAWAPAFATNSTGNGLVLNVPFPSHGRLHGARSFEQSARKQDKYMAACIPCNHHKRQSDMDPTETCRNNEMMEEGHTQQHRKNCLDHFYAHSSLLSKIHRRQPPNRRCFGHLLQQLDSINSNKKQSKLFYNSGLLSVHFSLIAFSRLAWPHSQKFSQTQQNHNKEISNTHKHTKETPSPFPIITIIIIIILLIIIIISIKYHSSTSLLKPNHHPHRYHPQYHHHHHQHHMSKSKALT